MHLYPYKRIKIRSYEKGLYFRDREFRGVLDAGVHWLANPKLYVRVDVLSQREPWIEHEALDLMIKSGALKDRAVVLDLKDDERALVWIDGRFDRAVGPGRYALWTGVREIRAEVLRAAKPRLEHAQIAAIVAAAQTAPRVLDPFLVEQGHAGVVFVDGAYTETLGPGTYAFWNGVAKVVPMLVDLREKVLDVTGQEIITSDKVSLRLNATVSYTIADPLLSLTSVADARQALYREAQLALRAVVGTRTLESLLTDKDSAGAELEAALTARVNAYGLAIVSLGIRDIILPGDMRELMNKVMEAQKAAEANAIARREETAAMRSQANTAKLLENNATLMRLRELEVLEKIAGNTKLSVVLGEKGLADRVMSLI